MTKDLIDRTDALAAIALGDTVNQLQVKILAIPSVALPARGVGVKPPLSIRDWVAPDHEYRPSMDPDDQGDCAECGNSVSWHNPPPPALSPAPDARGAALREALDNKEQLGIWAQEILEGLAFADVLKIESYDDKIEAHSVIGRGIVEVLRALINEART